MALTARVWSAGKLLVLAGALLATYGLFAAAAMRLAFRAREVQVPNLVDKTASEASAIAAAQGLTIRVDEARRTDEKIAVDRVVSQDPLAGSTTRRQRTVRVWLSAGLRSSIVPAVSGETERAAQMRIAQDGLELAAISEIRSQAYPSEIVVAQDPAANGAAARIALLVNRGERGPSYVMPDLIGVNADHAADVLREQGFRVAVVGSIPYPGVAAGVVLRQNPPGGFQVAPGEPISIEVSR
jgi:serine/threonine-protein kinase